MKTPSNAINTEKLNAFRKKVMEDATAMFPDGVFYPARKKLLVKWMEEGVFRTPLFYKKYHDLMVANISDLLKEPEYSVCD